MKQGRFKQIRGIFLFLIFIGVIDKLKIGQKNIGHTWIIFWIKIFKIGVINSFIQINKILKYGDK